MPFSIQNWLNCLDINSPPLSDLKHFILCLIWTYAITLNFLNTSFFCFKKLTKVHLELSSINVTKYCDSPKKIIYIEPYKSKCTNVDNWVVLFPPSIGNLVFNYYFFYKQLWHKCISSGSVLILKPWTKDLSCIDFNFWMATWPNILCHNSILVHF
jgi:hypothetical protein